MQVEDQLISQEPLVRLAAFLAVLAVVALCEIAAPRRVLWLSRARRWPANLGIAVLNTLLLRVLFPFAAVGVAGFAQTHDVGLLNHFDLGFWPSMAVTLLILDFAVWLQHVLLHAVPALWRLHRVHHADLEFDVTTGSRFHPLEMVLSALLKFAVILALGPPLLAVLVFEVLLNATSMFNHGNFRLPSALDRVLRWIVVTPDMHRVHHSVEVDETNSNFGFNLPWWDRLFGTYRAAPRAGHDGMTIGLAEDRDPAEVETLIGMIMLPFRRKPVHNERGAEPREERRP
jgi:sterol desaturase/sphingolipid hydroxylase (fatty acid hydroxylase superfamily)